jgi:hypothetical protein
MGQGRDPLTDGSGSLSQAVDREIIAIADERDRGGHLSGTPYSASTAGGAAGRLAARRIS